MSRTGIYIYAFGDGPTTLPEKGLGDAPVRTIAAAGLVAYVSDAPSGRLRPERRHLSAHQGVLRALMEGRTVLPVSFGVVARNEAEVRGIIASNASQFREQCERVHDRVEHALRLSWDVPDLARHLVERHPDLRAARDAMVAHPSHDNKVRAGRAFENVLNAEREALTASLLAAIEPVCAEVVQNPLRADREVVNLACLVGRGESAAFDQAVERAASLFDETFRFDLSGPWAPHSFVRMNIAPPTDGADGLSEAA
jgi:hypothetical protein